MDKRDLIIVVILFVLMLAWPMAYQKFFPSSPAPAKTQTQTNVASVSQGVVSNVPSLTASVATSAPPKEVKVEVEEEAVAVSKPEANAASTNTVSGPAKPEQRVALTNDDVIVTVSSWGGGVSVVELKQYREKMDKKSGQVIMDLAEYPSLAYTGLPGLSQRDDVDMAGDAAKGTVTLTSTTSAGLQWVRAITLLKDYRLKISDTFSNGSAQPVEVPEHQLQLGPMKMVGGESRVMGIDMLGIDTQMAFGGEGMKNWGGKLRGFFKEEREEKQLPKLPLSILRKETNPIDWLAVKNKFFVQILMAEGGAAGYVLQAKRELAPGERENPAVSPKDAVVEQVSAAMLFAAKTLNPGETLTHEISYYAGPKKYDILKQLGLRQDEVMEFGMWSPVCKFLLKMLNWLYSLVPNYGIAIILLTVIIRIAFWPITHKSTESMKKMQALQPLMTEIRKKFKDNPKKMQEETMALYKKNKVNPLSGCLPMLVQIPVFIALFVVLRSAVELRFADFLWIYDLSEPERLLANILPIPLNILPIVMSVTMAWQQTLMPTSDPTQQKIMLIFMPVMMLIMFYNIASALVLYWTTNQVIMIGQQLIQKYRTARKTAAQAPDAKA